MCKGNHFLRHIEETACFFSISYTNRKIAALSIRQSEIYYLIFIYPPTKAIYLKHLGTPNLPGTNLTIHCIDWHSLPMSQNLCTQM